MDRGIVRISANGFFNFEEWKDTLIEQTINATLDQQEGISSEDDEDLTDLIAEIIVNTDIR